MFTAKILCKCELCKKRSFITKKRKITMPMGEVFSQKMICSKCQKVIQQAVNMNK